MKEYPKINQKMFFRYRDRKVYPCIVNEVYEKEDEIWITIIKRNYQISRCKMAFYDIGQVLFYSKKEAEEGQNEN